MPNESYAHCIAFGQGINTCTRGECASGRSTDPVYAPRPVSLQDMVRDDENAASTKDPMDHMERVQRM
jgi:hypothetical protein